ncbi:MAG: hypothetical protein MPJ22_00355 [Pirellulales bacterium]|nr:hypothetical protein [Pirellulales bacterium]
MIKLAAKKRSTKKAAGKVEPINEAHATIIQGVVDQLKPELEKKLTTVRNDLAADLAEQVAALQAVPPAPAPTPVQAAPTGAPAGAAAVMPQIVEALKGGNIDLSKIGALLGQVGAPQMPTGPGGMPLDVDKLSEGQMKFLQMQNQNQQMSMLMQVLPMLIGQGGGGNAMLTEMMNRIFLEKITSSIYMDKAIITKLAQSIGAPPPPDTGLTTPITDSVSKLTSPSDQNSTGAPVRG